MNSLIQTTMVLCLAAGGIAQSTQASFASPEAGLEALRAACEANDTARLLEVLGADAADLVQTADAAQDALMRKRFVARCAEGMSIQRQDDGSAVAILGAEAWPMPIPLLEKDGGWRFDAAAGMEELINRRVGENELNAISVCHVYVAAQTAYTSKDHDGDGVHEYAQQIPSSVGKHDGLYWPADLASGEEASPLGPLAAAAGDYMEGRQQGAPWFGYYYRVLTRQGEHPPGGVYSYVIGGNMIAGFALIAYPANYGDSGVMTFMVSHHGKVYEKDLGPATADIVSYIKEFDPDSTWTVVTED